MLAYSRDEKVEDSYFLCKRHVAPERKYGYMVYGSKYIECWTGMELEDSNVPPSMVFMESVFKKVDGREHSCNRQ